MSMENKRIILITGANKGIGFTTAHTLAAASPNNHIIMTGRSLPKLSQALKDIQSHAPAGSLSILELDITHDASIAAAVAHLSTTYPRLDALINNAAIWTPHAFSTTTRTLLHTAFNTNVFGAVLLTNALSPLLQKSQDPRIVNVSSSMGSITERFDFEAPFSDSDECEAYRMCKAALNMATACQAYAFREWGCRVWAYCPGYVVTEFTGVGDVVMERRREGGAEGAETSAVGIKEILGGERDGETNVFVRRYGKVYPW